MRLGSVLLRRPGRRPPKEPIPFKEVLTMQIKNEVSGKGERSADSSCLQEMAVMFACMKKNEFKEVKCSPEIEIFQKCYSEYKAKAEEVKQRADSGKAVVGRNPRNLTSKQLNLLLQKYPQINEKIQ